jgi:HlyD family secretion protein
VTNFTVKVRILRESYQTMRDSLPAGKSVFNPGMSATVDIMTKKAYDIVSVPIQAVTTRDTTDKGKKMTAGDKKGGEDMEEMDKVKVVENKKEDVKDEKEKKTECVFVVENGKVKLQPVKVGIQDNNYIEIKEGLKDGQQVVSAPYSAISRFLKDGDVIQVVKKDKLYSEEKK